MLSCRLAPVKFIRRGLDLEPCIPGTEHVKGMPKIPAFIVAVPAPACVRVGIVAPTGATERAGGRAGKKMAPIGGCVGRDSSTIAGYNEVAVADKSKLHGREHGKEEKRASEGQLQDCHGRVCQAEAAGPGKYSQPGQ